MAKKAFSLSRVLELLNESKSSDEQRCAPTHTLVIIDMSAPREVALELKRLLSAEQSSAELSIKELEYGVGGTLVPDLAIFVVGSQLALVAKEAKRLAEAGVPCALIAESSLDLPSFDNLDESFKDLLTPIAVSNIADLAKPLAQWMVEASDKAVAFAASYSFCRQTLIDSLILLCAAQNAAVGAVDIIHGSDFPIMTVNQIKLALSIAAASGRSLSPSFLIDTALVLACGLSWRQIARSMSNILPIGNWLGRGAMGFAGTMATAQLLEAQNDGSLARAAAMLKDKLLTQRAAVKEAQQSRTAVKRIASVLSSSDAAAHTSGTTGYISYR
ncbi:hypothetical protein [Atopobium sp. oral taxon 810]|uniref:hypothetical protein n=1 Tax=Atopobium sp. oral taxon 810 TaxID=712158 RepID=UPI000397B3E5|nr:hypothetical protein [Atopobium sp. oral taxon 810]ERI04764.1 hypothetical protein HMPREF9069_01242 [Atopobium sp. oral taxon 810 str. F0209]